MSCKKFTRFYEILLIFYSFYLFINIGKLLILFKNNYLTV